MRKLVTFASTLWDSCGLIALAAVIIATACGVLARLIGSNSFSWSFEVLGFAFIWLSVLGVVMAEAKGENVSFDLIDKWLSPKAAYRLAIVRHVILGVFGLAVARSSWAMLGRTAFTPSPVMRIPMWVPQVSVAVLGLGLCTVEIVLIIKIMRRFRGQK